MSQGKRVRCCDEVFLNAVYSSKTYAEVSEKTGQKLSTTISRYARMKKKFYEDGRINLPNLTTNNNTKDHLKVKMCGQKLLSCME